MIDVGAERVFAAQRNGERIAVEIKFDAETEEIVQWIK